MDPLSIIASTIAIATPVTIGLQKLRDARHAKSDLLMLSNEVAEVIVLLRELEQITLQRNENVGRDRPSPILIQAVDAAKTKLEQLSSQISEWDGNAPPQVLATKSRGLRWVVMSSKVNTFKVEFKRVRENLMAVLATMTLSGSARVEMSLQEVFVFAKETTASQRIAHTELQKNLLLQHKQVKELLRQLSLGGPTSNVPRIGQTGQGLIDEQIPQPLAPSDEDYVKAFHHNGSVLFDSAQMTSVAAVGIRTTQFPRTSCTPWCSCVCHRERRLRTPRMLEQFIGSLFIGYSGLPVFRPPCNERSCHLQAQPLTYVTYFFPRWFLSRMVTFMMTVTPLAGPVASLKVQRTVPGSADIFTYAKLGDVDNIRRLFENGSASPHDVHSESGITPLHMVVNHQHIRAAKFLLQANADPFMSDHSQCTSADNAWTKILSKCLKPDDERTLRDLFSETECVERREFTVLHKIVLGLVQRDIEQELKASTAEINVPEIIGRTPLSMAAERSEAEAVATLLKYGADPGISSYSQTSALHYAASAKDPECVRLLLEAGINVDSMTNWDQTPLHFAAAYTKDVRHAKLLLDYGAEPNKRDRDGITPLSWCAISNNPDVAIVLLERGAYVEGVDNEGSSALQRAIKSNRHEVLELIVQQKPRIEACVPEGVSIWHLIAANADMKTIWIICQLDFSGTTDKIDDTSASAIEVLQKRPDRTSELRAAFEGLLQSVRASGNGDDGPETGQEEEDVWEDAVEQLEDYLPTHADGRKK